MVKSTSVLVIVFVTICAVQSATTKPKWMDCMSTSDCPKDECCVLHMQRYSIPTCNKRRGLGESCRVGNEPSSPTVSYPSNESFKLTDIYTNLCDCSPELICNRGTCERHPNHP